MNQGLTVGLNLGTMLEPEEVHLDQQIKSDTSLQEELDNQAGSKASSSQHHTSETLVFGANKMTNLIDGLL
jgi:hypothetical protein